MDKREFEEKCYEFYKIFWMLNHGYTLNDYLNHLALTDEELALEGNYPEGDAGDILYSLDKSFEENGFSGEIWASINEFLENEYRDHSYMNNLFRLIPDSNKMRQYYTKYVIMD